MYEQWHKSSNYMFIYYNTSSFLFLDPKKTPDISPIRKESTEVNDSSDNGMCNQYCILSHKKICAVTVRKLLLFKTILFYRFKTTTHTPSPPPQMHKHT
jgi:hypothetical protein